MVAQSWQYPALISIQVFGAVGQTEILAPGTAQYRCPPAHQHVIPRSEATRES